MTAQGATNNDRDRWRTIAMILATAAVIMAAFDAIETAVVCGTVERSIARVMEAMEGANQ